MLKNLKISFFYRIVKYLLKINTTASIYYSVILTKYYSHYVKEYPVNIEKLINYIFSKFTIEKSIISGTGVLILMSKNEIIKVPLDIVQKESLNKEFNIYNKLKKSDIHELVDYSLVEKNLYGINYYLMDKLNSINNVNFFEYVSKTLRKNHTKESTKNIEIDSIQIGLKIVKNLINEKQLNIIYSKAIEEEVTVSYMHGDLTPLNIMSKNNMPLLIDLDRFEFRGITEIDKIHYIIEQKAKEKKITSFLLIKNILNKKEKIEELKNINKNLMFIYLLHKIGSEYSEKIDFPDRYYYLLKDTLKEFIIDE